MDLAVVAEGVENESTLRQIAALGCQQAQGFYISKPLPAAEFEKWLTGYEPAAVPERRGPGRAFS